MFVWGLFLMPQPTYAGDCTQPVDDVTDYMVEITSSINFRSSIQGGEADECPESQVIGSFAKGQMAWVVGEIETGVPVEEGSEDYLSWLYVQHPVTKEYGFLWGKYAQPIDTPQDELGHEEVVIEPGSVTGTGLPAEEVPVTDEECEVIDETDDYFVQVTDSLNVRDGVCFGVVINSLDAEDVVKVIGELNEWYYIIHTDGSKGFVHSDYVEVVETPEENLEDEEVLVGNDRAVKHEEPLEADPIVSGDTLPDVVGHEYETAIRYLESEAIIKGYPDGFYKAKLPVNRAEFTKIVVGAELGSEPFSSADDCFVDVAEDDWFSSYVCYAKDAGIIEGYADGEFKPATSINLVEAAKILVNTFEIKKGAEGEQWYEVYLGALENRNYIPASFLSIDELVDRGQMAEMMWRILKDVTNKSSKSFGFADDPVSQEVSQPAPNPGEGYVNACYDTHLPSSVDMQKVRNTWLLWHNNVRAENNADTLKLHEALNYSGNIWSQSNETSGSITHDRGEGVTTSDWFDDLGITFQALEGYVFAENIASNSYTCDSSDCTEELLASLEAIFNEFINEKGQESSPHFDNIIRSDFNQMGLGLAVDEANQKVYITVHFAQAVESFPDTCE